MVSAESNDQALAFFQDLDLPLMHGGLAPLPRYVGQACMDHMPRKKQRPDRRAEQTPLEPKQISRTPCEYLHTKN
jgi:hypothetical protein